jgi:integrase/recombinase XerD
MSAPTLARLLESFFRQRLVTQRNASPATVESYRDALRLLVRFVSKQVGRPPCDLAVTDFDRDAVLHFLDQLEHQRGNGVRTRNARLIAIRSFFRHVAASDPAAMAVSQRVLSIPTKRTTSAAPRYLTAPDIAALLNAPNRQTSQGRRDHAFLLFLVRTGARVSETIGIDAADLRLEPPTRCSFTARVARSASCPLPPTSLECCGRFVERAGWGATSDVPSSSGYTATALLGSVRRISFAAPSHMPRSRDRHSRSRMFRPISSDTPWRCNSCKPVWTWSRFRRGSDTPKSLRHIVTQKLMSR